MVVGLGTDTKKISCQVFCHCQVSLSPSSASPPPPAVHVFFEEDSDYTYIFMVHFCYSIAMFVYHNVMWTS